MKTGIYFNAAASVIVSGQKNSVVNATPQLIVNSTKGKFTVTAPVSKALNVAVGEYIMFVDDFAEVERQIQAGNEQIAAYANENGIDMTTRDGINTLVNALGHYYIAKGLLKYDKAGAPVLTPVRMTEDEKRAYIMEHKDEIVSNNREALIERNGGNDADVDTLIALVGIDEVEYPKVQDAEGSKTSTTSSSTGVGCTLGFTDNAVWNKIKSDLDDDNKTSVNRYFDVCLDTPLKGNHKGVEFVMYPIEFVEDKEVSRNKKNED